jgi:histidine decarboxylase
MVGGNADAIAIDNRLDELYRRLEQCRETFIGFPVSLAFDYQELLPFFNQMMNNAGDPFVDHAFRNHTKDMEREVIDFFADLFRAPADDRWGYVTNGGSESNLYALYLARSLYPNGMVYHSTAAHYSVDKAIDILGMPSTAVRCDDRGEIDYDDLAEALRPQRFRPAIVFANVGTTMTEAVDDVRKIKQTLRSLTIRDSFIHADAALCGIPLALREQRPRFDLADGADSISFSGHKFIGSPVPCGVVLTRASLSKRIGRTSPIVGSPDTTITGSRSGHGPLVLWYVIRKYGLAGLRERAEEARDVAAYALDRLIEIGWSAWRNPDALTVVLRKPPDAIVSRWMLATSDGVSHIVCVPGVTRTQIDKFVADLAATEEAQAVRSGQDVVVPASFAEQHASATVSTTAPNRKLRHPVPVGGYPATA